MSNKNKISYMFLCLISERIEYSENQMYMVYFNMLYLQIILNTSSPTYIVDRQ